MTVPVLTGICIVLAGLVAVLTIALVLCVRENLALSVQLIMTRWRLEHERRAL